MKFVSILAAALLVASGATQAQTAQGTPPKPVKEAKDDQRAAGALTDAVVQRVDSARGEFILKHGDIPNLAMPPMTMAFAAEPKMLGSFKVGDKVRFHAEIVNGKPTVTHMEAVR